MNTPTMTTKGEQAKNQLIAAALAQFGEYGLHATTRDIAAQAGQNIAAITYYFGSKEDLYLACAQWIADFIGSQFRPHAEEAERLFAQPEPDRGAMRELILRACKNMIMLLTQDDTVNLSKFISREQLSPTAAYQLVHDQVINYSARFNAKESGVMKKPVVLGLVIAALVAVIAGGTWWYQSRQDNGLTLYGNVDIRSVNLSFRVGGRLASLAVDEGDAITAGQVLGELDHAPYENALMQAKANVAAAQAQYDLMLAGYREEEIAQTAAAVKQAQAAYDYAQNFYNRQVGLWKSRTISANDLENARSSRDQALASLKSAQDKLAQYRSGNRVQDIEQAKATLEQAQAELAQAELNLHDTTLTSPSDGTILTRAVEPGSMLNEGGTVLTLSLTRPVWIRAYVDERNLSQAQPGREILLYTDGRPDKPYHGKIGFVSPTAEFTPKTVETPDLRTDLVYRLRIVVTDADDALRQGMPVTIKFGDEARHD